MAEVKEERVSGINGHVGGGTETLGGSRVCEEAIGNVFCNGDDIMVEIWGSDVYLDGVCTSVNEDAEGNLNDEGKNLSNGGLVQPLVDSGAVYKSVPRVELVEDKEVKLEKVVDGDNSDISVDDPMNYEVEKQQKVDEDSPVTISSAKVSLAPGECIRRAASRIAGSPSVLKYSIMEETSSVEDWLSLLLSAAENPLLKHELSNTAVSFFFEFRNSVVSDQHLEDTVAGGKRKRLPSSTTGFPGTFEFDEDTNDTYWTDMVVENGRSKEQLQIVPAESKPVQKTRRPYRRRHLETNGQVNISMNPTEYVDEDSPAELVLNFHETDLLPSKVKLSKTFRYFGPIRESQTEVDRENRRARVVFLKCSDAKIACNSAGIFNIFGAVVVSYKVNHGISEPFKIHPTETSLPQEDSHFPIPSQT